MPAIKSPEFETISHLSSAAGWVGTAVGLIKFIYTFGKSNPIEVAIERIERELDEIRSNLTDLTHHLNTVTQRLAEAENSERVRFVNLYRLELERCLNELANAPGDRSVASNVAFKAAGVADAFLTDMGLWNWTDIRIDQPRDGYGQPAGPPSYSIEQPDFKLAVAFPVYSLALTTFVAGVVGHAQGDKDLVRSRYGAQLERHLNAVGVRNEWNDDATMPPATIAEHIQSRITCTPVAVHEYDRDRVCAFSVQCRNQIEQTNEVVGEFSHIVPESPFPTLCTISPDSVIGYEQDVQRSYPALEGLALWEEILDSLLRSARLPGKQFIGTFGTISPNFILLYASDFDYQVRFFEQVVPMDGSTWRDRGVIASEFVHDTVVSAGGDWLYARDNYSGEWLLYPGIGERPLPMGSGFSSIADAPVDFGGVALPPTWAYFGGGHGVIYGVVTGNPDDQFAVGDLYWVSNKVENERLVLRTPRKVGNGWDMFRFIATVGEGVIYGVNPDGGLRWYRHQGWESGSGEWDAPRDLETPVDWSQCSQVIGSPGGCLLGIYPDGEMVRFMHTDWKTGGSAYEGPEIVDGDWSHYRSIVALLPAEAEQPA